MSEGTPVAPAAAPAAPTEGGAPGDPNRPSFKAEDAQAAPAKPSKLKIGDWEMDESAARSEIERGRQSGKLLTEAQKRLERASGIEKRFEALKASVKKSPKAALEALGLSKEEASDVFSRYLYEEEILPSQMSPEQQRMRQMEAQLKGYEEEKNKTAETAKETKFKSEVEQASNKLVKEIQDLLAAKKVPATRVFMRRMAHYLSSYNENGADIPTERAAEMAIEDYKSDFNHFFGESSIDQMEEFLGKETLYKLASKVSQWAIAKRKGPQAPPKTDVPQVNNGRAQGREKKTDPNALMKKYSGGVI